MILFWSFLCHSDLILSLSNIVYDALRPVVVHVNPLETLTDMCSILKVHCSLFVASLCGITVG